MMIFGWQPSQNDDQVDIPYGEPPMTSPMLHMPHFDNLSSHASCKQSLNPTPQASSPTSSTSSLFPEPDIPPVPDQYTDPRRDPAWVARPRNPFIIFRCEYSKANARDTKRVRRTAGSHIEKTLSKRAAEAWRELSPEEKDRFKVLADQERDEHARKNPHYRFRPMKRPAGQKRRLKPSAARALKLSPSCASEKPLPRQPPPTPEPQAPTTGGKGNRPRSFSVPTPIGQQPFLQPLDSVTPKPEFKRSRSMSGCVAKPQDETCSWSMPEGLAYEPKIFPASAHADSGLYVSEQAAPVSNTLLQHDFSTVYHPTPTSHISPLAAVASSLSGWNDMSSSDPLIFASPPLQHLWSPSQMGSAAQPMANFTSPDNASVLGYPLHPADSWDPAALSFDMLSSPLGNDLIFTPSNGSSYTTIYDDLECASALQEFSIGLNECTPITTDVTNQDTTFALEMDGYFRSF